MDNDISATDNKKRHSYLELFERVKLGSSHTARDRGVMAIEPD